MSQKVEMLTTDGRQASPSFWPLGVRMRMKGPGGYYNLGNALGLTAGIAFQVLATGAGADASVSHIVRAHLVGSPGATALSLAMIMFFISGELYHRALKPRTGPDAMMMRRADFLSGVAALVLSIALVLFGSFWLACVSTVLLAGGKLGSAVSPDARWPVRVTYMTIRGTTLCREYDLFRLAPLLSRVPATMSILIEITRVLAVGPPGTALLLGQSAVLLTCYLLWGRADLLLLRR